MNTRASLRSHTSILLLLFGLLLTAISPSVSACGGFFCQTTPINQAGEQIVFRQDGDQTTAMVRILYTGEAENFSWVVPVPNTPEISLGSDATFDELELATRPQFELERIGESCPVPLASGGPNFSAEDASTDGSDGVVIEQQFSVGPFAIDVVSSDNPDDLAIWLQENEYQLTDAGSELIAPYVTAGMKFVAVKLNSGEASGSIQPLIMRYQSSQPVIPIRLTAVAAEADMGVLVWVLGNARAVPQNYEHVVPNYTRLNWYSGTRNAYASYQTLITAAMNETESGQGFATDYAGGITSNILEQLTMSSSVENRLAELDRSSSDAEFITQSVFTSNDPDTQITRLQALLPLGNGEDSSVFLDPAALQFLYSPQQLQEARSSIRTDIVERELEPLRSSIDILSGDLYMTRLYTTLSADEMTRDPSFTFNTDMPEQGLLRAARLEASCDSNGSRWTLTLGQGTGREGETVVRANLPVPFGIVPPATADQPAAFIRQRTSADALPDVLFQATPGTLEIAEDGTALTITETMTDVLPVTGNSDDDNGFLGASTAMLWLVPLVLLRRRRWASHTTLGQRS